MIPKTEIEELYNSCPSNEYKKQYGIQPYDAGSSLPFRTFLVLIFNLEKDRSEDLSIKFSVDLNTNFGRTYLRYSLFVKGKFFSSELFYQVRYNATNYFDGSLFTLLNIHIEVNGIDIEMQKAKNEIMKKCYLDFVTNYKP